MCVLYANSQPSHRSQQGAGKEYVAVVRLHDALESQEKLSRVRKSARTSFVFLK
jgi:hypothetical protein